ncbi:MAG: hypothetical protein ACI9CO_000111 [Candidatus Azotimanducaceae bacterium]|jgi:hypothetical protein
MDNSTASMTPSEINEKVAAAGSAQTEEFTALLNQAASEGQKQLIRRAFALGARRTEVPQPSIEVVASDAMNMIESGTGFLSDMEAIFIAVCRAQDQAEATRLAGIGAYLAGTWCNDTDCERERLADHLGAAGSL